MKARFQCGGKHRPLFAAFLAWGICALATTAGAQPATPEVLNLPVQWMLPNGQLSPKTAARSGLELEVDTRWVSNYGYQPLKFTFGRAQPSTSDYQITVRFYADDSSSGESKLTVEQETELRAGENSVKMILRAPQIEPWSVGRWEVWIDGVREPALSLDLPNAMNFNRWQLMSLQVLSPFPTQSISPIAARNLFYRRSFAGAPLNRLQSPLPANWLDYTCLDVVSMKSQELAAENQQHPERIAALRRWLHAGGNLWIENTGTRSERLREIDEYMQLDSPAMPLERESFDETLPPGWTYAIFRSPAGATEDQLDRTHPYSPPELELDALQEDAESVAEGAGPLIPEEPETSRGWFVERAAGFGLVTAYDGEWRDTPDRFEREARGAALMRWHQRSWLPRHGLVPNVPNVEFSNFLMPGVGLAPVTEFRVLITLFVLCIGPLNYWVLSRTKRLYLLVITVPLGAAAVTLLLFAYAFLADGLTTQVRVRSLTYLNQPAGEAVSWSRLSYYAGFAPADGLSFPADTAIYPILPETLGWNPRAMQRSGRVVSWQDDSQHLSQGWLSSRTPTQYLAVRANETAAQLIVRSNRDRCQATNDLGSPLVWLLVVDNTGNLWQGTEIEPGQRLELQRVSPVDAIRRLRESLVNNKPELPAELQATLNASSSSARRRGRRFGFREAGDFRLSNNLMELNLTELGEISAAAGLDFLPRTFIAQAATAVEAPLGLPAVEEVDSYHLIVGRW